MTALPMPAAPRPHYLTFLATLAEQQPDKIALRVSAGAANPGAFAEHSYMQLHGRVLALSRNLRALVPQGERALILMPSGAEFITAFLACLHAGLIAVPAYPPRRNRNRERVLAIHDDAQPALILTTAAAEPHMREALPGTKAGVVIAEATAFGVRQSSAALAGAERRGGDTGIRAQTTPDAPRPPKAASPMPGGPGISAAALHNAPLHNAGGIAFLQYTSGSTGAPKGTIITHANLLANLAGIQALFAHEPGHEFVSWLPPYHDMGLMALLEPLFRGMTVTLLAPDEFLRQPVRWLRVIASRAAHVSSGAPNFAYQLLADRVKDDDLAALDLSRWRIAFNGAEPVRAETLEKFALRFAKCGFREEAWLPCYGLAETTLLASGHLGVRRQSVAPTPLWQERSDAAGSADDAIEDPLRASGASQSGVALRFPPHSKGSAAPVSCGPPALDTRITIHDPETGAELPAGSTGEIRVHSPSVAAGYWRNEAATAAAFPQPGTLRTGDLGFLHDGELFVTGRLKDLIIIRGRNLHPHDIEACVAANLPAATGANSIAAFEFTGNGSGTAALGLLIEAPRTWVSALKVERAAPRALPADATEGNARGAARSTGEVIARIREAVAEKFEVTADLIAFVAPGDFPRTSSGKVQRGACRDGVVNGTLPVIFRDQLSSPNTPPQLPEALECGSPLPLWQERSDAAGTTPGHDATTDPPRLRLPPQSGRGQPHSKTLRAISTIMLESSTTADALIQWLRAFAARRLNSQLMDERRTVAPHVVLEFGNHGLFGLEVPRALGGLGLSTSDSYRVMEQLAAIDLTLALLVGIHNALGLHPILRHGLPALREELIPAMAGGRHLASFAITELSAGSHPKTIATTAVLGGDGGWTIHGRKQWIGIASWASTIVVIAKAQGESGEHLGSVALAVSADADGVSFGPEAVTMGVRGVVQVPVFFDAVKVDAARVLGEVGRGFEVAYDAMRVARVGLATLSLGAMKRCLQWMNTYAAEREVAGGRLADLPATQSRLAETVSAIAAVESLVRAVGGWLDAGLQLPEEVFLICKTTAPELLGETADRAMQMLGARGYMENNGLPQLFRDARLLRIFEGPTEALNASLGARLRRGSDALCEWMETVQGTESAAAIRALVAEHPTANDVALGELASLHFLRWIVIRTDASATASWSAVAEMRGRSLASATPLSTAPRTSDDQTTLESGVALTLPTALQNAAAWLEERLRQRSAAADAPTGTVAVSDIAARLQQEIGAFDQSLPGEDRELDALLRLASVSDRRAVNDGSRGFQPTVPDNKTVSRSDTRTTGPAQGGNDDPPPPSNVAPRRDGISAANRGLKSTATGMDRSAVGENVDGRDGNLVEHLERGLLDFLQREKLGNMQSVPHEATFSSLGIDSLAAASLAVEIEQVFGVKIRDETLYDYPTLQRLAGYIVSRRAPVGTPAEQGRALWGATLDSMNERVNRVKEAGRYFYGIPFESQDAASAMIDGKRCVMLSGYSYLGLMHDPEIKRRVAIAIEGDGVSSHGSRLLANGEWHEALEDRIATTLSAEAALVFTTGFATNAAVIPTLMSAEDTILADEWIHASLVDGCKASGATFTFFRHNNLEHLAELLKAPTRGKTLVVIDAVFSMEGDIAPVPEISALAHAHGAWLMVDEAHSLGVLGARGLGVQEHFGLAPEAIDIKMGTLSKAIPSAGGYIAGSTDLIAALRHNVRYFIFSVAPTPPMVAAAMAGFDILLAQPERVRTLHDNIRIFRDGLRRIGLTPPDTGTAIIPLPCRDEDSAFTFAKRCLADGLYVTPIVFPAVPQNAPRIRTSITAALGEEDIALALEVIGRHREWLV